MSSQLGTTRCSVTLLFLLGLLSKHASSSGLVERGRGGLRPLGSFTVRQLLNADIPSDLNPCTPQQVKRWENYVLGIILWGGAHIDDTLGNGTAINPCHNDKFTAHLAEDGATVDVYGVQVDEFTVLRSYPSLIHPGSQLDQAITGQPFPLLISFLFSNEFVSTPFVAASVDRTYSLAEGVVQQQTVVLSSDLDTFTVKPYTIFSPGCPRCSFNYTAYFDDHNITVPSDVDQSSLNLTCINGIQCAWGVGFCRYCVRGLQQSQVRTSHDWFDEAFVRGGSNSTNLQRYNACITFCHAFHYLMWFGADFSGRMLRSQDVYRFHLNREPLAAYGAFPEVFAIGETLWDAIQTAAYVSES